MSTESNTDRIAVTLYFTRNPETLHLIVQALGGDEQARSALGAFVIDPILDMLKSQTVSLADLVRK